MRRLNRLLDDARAELATLSTAKENEARAARIRAEEEAAAAAALVRTVPAQMWAGRAHPRRRCGWGEPSPGADVGGVSRVPVQTCAG